MIAVALALMLAQADPDGFLRTSGRCDVSLATGFDYRGPCLINERVSGPGGYSVVLKTPRRAFTIVYRGAGGPWHNVTIDGREGTVYERSRDYLVATTRNTSDMFAWCNGESRDECGH